MLEQNVFAQSKGGSVKKFLPKIMGLVFVVVSLALLVYIITVFHEPEGKTIPNSITIAELRDEIKKGRPFYLNIDNEKRLRFLPDAHKWWISEKSRQRSK